MRLRLMLVCYTPFFTFVSNVMDVYVATVCDFSQPSSYVCVYKIIISIIAPYWKNAHVSKTSKVDFDFYFLENSVDPAGP